MHNLQEATERICELKGSLVALDALIPALLKMLPPAAGAPLMHSFDEHAEAARTVMLNASISDLVLATFERDVERTRVLLAGLETPAAVPDQGAAADAVLLATTRVQPMRGGRSLPAVSGFFFRRDRRLYLVTCAHALVGPDDDARPDRVALELHHDPADLTRRTVVSIPLVAGEGAPRVHGGVAALEVDVRRLPETALLRAFDPSHLIADGEAIGVGDALDVIGFSQGGYDTVNHLAVVRRAWVASAYGVRYRERGCFMTDTAVRQGGGGAPVLRRRRGPAAGDEALPWQLVGVHSAHIDACAHEAGLHEPPAGGEEAHGLSCAWYADVLMTLTAEDA